MEVTLVEMDASIRNFRIDFRTDLWRRISAVARNTTTQAKQGRQAGPIGLSFPFPNVWNLVESFNVRRLKIEYLNDSHFNVCFLKKTFLVIYFKDC
jgi:hypothetical protein